jgi:hypothetical protein
MQPLDPRSLTHKLISLDYSLGARLAQPCFEKLTNILFCRAGGTEARCRCRRGHLPASRSGECVSRLRSNCHARTQLCAALGMQPCTLRRIVMLCIEVWLPHPDLLPCMCTDRTPLFVQPPRLRWAAGVVDNEGLGRKSSKCTPPSLPPTLLQYLHMFRAIRIAACVCGRLSHLSQWLLQVLFFLDIHTDNFNFFKPCCCFFAVHLQAAAYTTSLVRLARVPTRATMKTMKRVAVVVVVAVVVARRERGSPAQSTRTAAVVRVGRTSTKEVLVKNVKHHQRRRTCVFGPMMTS